MIKVYVVPRWDEKRAQGYFDVLEETSTSSHRVSSHFSAEEAETYARTHVRHMQDWAKAKKSFFTQNQCSKLIGVINE